MSGFPGMSHWEDEWAVNRRHIEKLRDKYVKGTASEEEIEEYWLAAVKDPQEMELLATEVNLREVIRKQQMGRS